VITVATRYGTAVADTRDRRYDKTATIYFTGLHLAGIFIWSTR
jgi:hypothetical protein